MQQYLAETKGQREENDRIGEIRKQLEILEEPRLGIVGYNKIAKLMSENREEPTGALTSSRAAKAPLSDQENFREVKRFVNKYRDKLVIKPVTTQTLVDKLEGKNVSMVRENDIDFDFQSFNQCRLLPGSDSWSN